MNQWLLEGVRTRCLRRVAAGILVVAVATGVVVYQRRYVQNFFGGPYPLDVAELNAIDDASTTPRYFATVKGGEAIDTGIRAVTIRTRGGVETSRSTSGTYYLLPVGNHFLLCKSNAGVQAGYQGELAPIPPKVAEAVFSTPEAEALRDRVFPYYLNDVSFREPGAMEMVVLVIVIFLLARHGLPAWRYLHNPSSHPLVRRVRSWPDPIGTMAAAQKEAGSFHYRGGAGWLVTDRFLVQSSFFSFDVFRIADLLWAYKKVTQHSVNFVPTRKTYETILVCYGGAAVIPAPPEGAQAILAFVAARAPWARFGYTDDLAADFKRDANAFAAAVEMRRHSVRRGSGAERAPNAAAGRRVRGKDVEETIELMMDEARAGTRRRVQAGDGSILEVKVPAGVEFGTVLRLVGKGLPAPAGGGTAGHLYLYVILEVRRDSRSTDRGSVDRN